MKSGKTDMRALVVSSLSLETRLDRGTKPFKIFPERPTRPSQGDERFNGSVLERPHGSLVGKAGTC
jgi:hypothetical protein